MIQVDEIHPLKSVYTLISVAISVSVGGALPLKKGPRWPPGTVWGQPPCLMSRCRALSCVCLSCLVLHWVKQIESRIKKRNVSVLIYWFHGYKLKEPRDST